MNLNPKFAVTVCLFALLAAPAVMFAHGDDDEGRYKGDKDKHHSYSLPEPSTLIMTLAGLGIGMGLVVAGVRRNRRTTIAA
jgi:hypothetical protein